MRTQPSYHGHVPKLIARVDVGLLPSAYHITLAANPEEWWVIDKVELMSYEQASPQDVSGYLTVTLVQKGVAVTWTSSIFLGTGSPTRIVVDFPRNMLVGDRNTAVVILAPDYFSVGFLNVLYH